MSEINGFRVLYNVLKKRTGDVTYEELKKALRLASLNKVLLQFLRDLNLQGSLRDQEEAKFRTFIKAIGEISNSLEGLDYAFFKMVKPVAYVPSDIDLLINPNSLTSALSRLRGLGYRIAVTEPYCITLSSPNAVVDLYLYPTLGGMIYLDGKKLLEFKRNTDFNGIDIPTLDDCVEALVSVAHAIFKERIYTLNDYFVLAEMSSPKTLRLAEEFKCIKSLAYAFRLNEEVDKGSLTLPYKVPLPLWFRIIGSKVGEDPFTRGSLLNAIKFMKDHRIGKLLTLKLTRRTY